MGSLVRIVKDGLDNLYSAHDANVGAIPVIFFAFKLLQKIYY